MSNPKVRYVLLMLTAWAILLIVMVALFPLFFIQYISSPDGFRSNYEKWLVEMKNASWVAANGGSFEEQE